MFTSNTCKTDDMWPTNLGVFLEYLGGSLDYETNSGIVFCAKWYKYMQVAQRSPKLKRENVSFKLNQHHHPRREEHHTRPKERR